MPIQASERASARDASTHRTLTSKIDKKILETPEGEIIRFSFHPGTSKRLVYNLASEYAAAGWTTSVKDADVPSNDDSGSLVLELWNDGDNPSVDGVTDDDTAIDLLDRVTSAYNNIRWCMEGRNGMYSVSISGSIFNQGNVSDDRNRGSSSATLDVRVDATNKDCFVAALIATTEFANLVTPLEL